MLKEVVISIFTTSFCIVKSKWKQISNIKNKTTEIKKLKTLIQKSLYNTFPIISLPLLYILKYPNLILSKIPLHFPY